MNRFGSHPNHENRIIYKGPPPQGLSGARRAGSFFEFSVTDPPHKEAPLAAAIIVPDGKGGNNPRIISEYYDFHRKTSFHSFILPICSADIASRGMRQRRGLRQMPKSPRALTKMFLNISPEPDYLNLI
jgi:hypothetical protein